MLGAVSAADPLKDSAILITGATGSFGRACIANLLGNAEIRKVVCFSRDEAKQDELRALWPDESADGGRLRLFLGDVRDLERLRLALRDINIVIHAAALKRIPAGEYDPAEFIKTNVLGAMNVVQAALFTPGLSHVLALSSDKAVNPLNLYGATKLCAEKLVLAANSYRGTTGPVFSCVRYGNVAGSRGSVIPVWRGQLAAGESIIITDPDMTRFWMSLPESVALVLFALRNMNGGEVYVPKLPSFRLGSLAEAMLFDHATKTVGLRKGEKIHETLIGQGEIPRTRDLGAYYCITENTGGGPTRVALSHVYSSDTNERWLTVEQLRDLVAEV